MSAEVCGKWWGEWAALTAHVSFVGSSSPVSSGDFVKTKPHPTTQSELAEEGKAGAFVTAPQGLFPAPLPPNRGGSRVLPRFALLGRAAAKALQDGRMLDVPLSHTFYRRAHQKRLRFSPLTSRSLPLATREVLWRGRMLDVCFARFPSPVSATNVSRQASRH